MKLVKILGIAALAIAAIAVVLAIAAAIWFDPNKFRGQISASVKEQTGRELSISGDLKLRFFPWLGVKINGVKLGNAQGFGPEPFAEVGEAQVSVRVLPLVLHQEVKAGTVSLDGLKLNLAKDAAGKNNWDDLGGKEKQPTPAKPSVQVSGPAPAFEIGGLEIKDASLSYKDAQAKKSYKIDQLNFKTGSLRPGKPVDIEAKLLLSSTDPNLTADMKLGGTLDADTAAQHYTFKKLKLDVVAQGEAVPGGKQDIKLTGDLDLDQGKGLMKFSDVKLELAGLTVTTQIDGKNLNGDAPSYTGPLTIAAFSPRKLLDELKIKIPEPSDAKALTEASFTANLAATDKSAALNDVKIKLDQTNLTGRIEVRDFERSAIAFDLKVDAIDLDRYQSAQAVAGEKATAAKKNESFNSTEIPVKTLDSINAQGSLAIGSLKVSGLQVSNVDVKLNLPKGQAKTDEVTAKLYGGSLTSHSEIIPAERPRIASKATLTSVQIGPLLKDMKGKDYVTGTGNLNFDINSSGRTVGDIRHALAGEVGFNLQNGAVKGFNLGQILREGQALLNRQVPSAGANEPKQTDFAELKGHGKIASGVLTTDYLTATNPAFRFTGEGTVDIGNERINFLAKPTVVETTEGSGGKGLDDLRGLTVPIRVTGTFDDPKYTIDIQEALKQKAAGRLNQEIEKQKGRLGDKLGEFLQRSLGPKDQQQQPQPQTPPKP